ncbi:hydantoinase B/oxoprolinase family protein [Roseovarius pacificus]|uniref:hydantoinase B/oxoprolinase family protein n=1 Tax=Roseovarius pacificus TaxID=337701 RepID=UPI002A18E8B5|nr:hydantoinase B/oxoprolinase family protein [Roseovarius pacificus]
MSVDPITLTLIQKRLDHISKYMGWAMMRTAQSPIFSESHDFSCFLSNARGDALSVADGLPIHTGSGDFAVRALLRDYGGDIYDGDVFLLSDPYEAGGNHLPDWTMIRPVVVDGALVAFATNRAHQSDIGGGAAGTYNAAATEIYHEGIRLPVLRLVEKGEVRRDLWKLLLLNSRTPELLDGDLAAMLGSTLTGRDRIADIVAELGHAETEKVFDAVLDHAQLLMKEQIETLPEGIYFGEEISDNDCFKTIDVPVKVKLTVGGGKLHVDFTGSSPQIMGFKNSSLANTHSAVFMAIMSFFDGKPPQNQGAMRQIEIVAPEGSVVNALPPAPMTMNTVHPASEIVHAVWKALAQANPSDALAGWGKTSHCITSGKGDNGRTFVMYHWHGSSGAGAVDGRDGIPGAGQLCTLGGMSLPNVEQYEQAYPIHIHHYEMRVDASGAGKFRGGTGLDYSVSTFVPAQYSFRGEGSRKPTGFGTVGGQDGKQGLLRLNFLSDGNTFHVPQYGVHKLDAAKVHITSPGGGGYGDPLERDPAHVLRDLRDGLISHETAENVYGLIADTESWTVDDAATRDKRAALIATT